MNKKKNDSELRRLLESRDMSNSKTKERLIGAGWTLFVTFCCGSIAASIFLSNKINEEKLKNQEPIEKEADEPTYTEEDIQKIVDEALKEYEKPEETKEPEIEEIKEVEEKVVEEDTNTYKNVDVKSYKGKNSITSLLKEMDLPTDKKFRAQLAVLYGIVEKAEDYRGTAAQNQALFDAIMNQGLILIVDENGKVIGFKTEDGHEINLDEEAQKIVNECMENKDKPKKTGGGGRGHKTETQPSVPQNNPTTSTTQPGQSQPTTPITQPSGSQNQGTTDITQPEQPQPTVPTGGNEGNSSDDHDRDDDHHSSGGDNGGSSNPDPQPPVNPDPQPPVDPNPQPDNPSGGSEDLEHGSEGNDDLGGGFDSNDNNNSQDSSGSSDDSSSSTEAEANDEIVSLSYERLFYQNLKSILENQKYLDDYILALTKDDNHLA